jgi:lipoprotein NlpI
LLWLHIARQRAGQDDKQEFEANAAKLDQGRWPWPLVAFYLGNESAGIRGGDVHRDRWRANTYL